MRVERLTLHGFMAHEKADVVFGDTGICVLAGLNRAGKSSLVDGLRWCLTNSARGVAASHVQDLVRRSAKTCSVDVELRHGPNTLAVHRTPSGGTPGQGSIASFLGTRDLEPLEAVLTGNLLDLKPKELEAAVFRAAGVQVTEAFLRGKGITDAEVLRAALDPRKGFSSAERVATEKKRAANRMAEEYSVEAPEDVEVETAAGKVKVSEVNTEEVSGGIRALRKKRDEINQLVGALAAWREPDVAGAREALRVNEEDLVHAKEAEAAAEKAHEPNGRAIDPIAVQLAGAQRVVESCQAAVIAARRLPAKGCTHACPVHAAVTGRDDVLAQAKKDLADAEHTRDVLIEQKDAADQAAGVTGDLLDEARQEAVESDAAVRASKATLAAAEASAKNRPAGDLVALRKELEALDVRVARGEEIREQASRYAEGVARAEKADVRRQLVVKEAEAFAAMEQALRPGGAMTELLAKPLSDFGGVFEEFAQSMLGDELTTLSDSWEVLYDGAPAALACTSERWRIAAALSLAMGAVSGLRFAVLDEASVCVGEDRGMLTAALMTYRKYFDQVLVVASQSEEELEALTDPGPETQGLVRIWKVTPGLVRPVAAAESKAA